MFSITYKKNAKKLKKGVAFLNRILLELIHRKAQRAGRYGVRPKQHGTGGEAYALRRWFDFMRAKARTLFEIVSTEST